MLMWQATSASLGSAFLPHHNKQHEKEHQKATTAS
jgi:hypothetical protein